MAGKIADIIRNSFNEAVASVAEAGVKAGTEKAKQFIGEATGIPVSGQINQNRSSERAQPADRRLSIEQQARDIEASLSEEDDAIYIEDDSPEPCAFAIYDREKNLECAAAYFRQLGVRVEDCEIDEDGGYSPEPFIVASHETTGVSFCGPMSEFWKFSEHQGFDEGDNADWDVYGTTRDENGDLVIDQKSIYEIRVGRDTIKTVAAMLMAYDSNLDEQFRENHIEKDGNSPVTRMAINIPHLEGAPLAHFGIPIAIIYEATKNGKRDLYIHEFGENSKQRPMMYTLGGKNEKKSVVIYGGDMDVLQGWVVH